VTPPTSNICTFHLHVLEGFASLSLAGLLGESLPEHQLRNTGQPQLAPDRHYARVKGSSGAQDKVTDCVSDSELDFLKSLSGLRT